MTTPLMEAQEVSKDFTVGRRLAPGGRRTVHAVDRVSLQVWPGETLGLVGEFGCGKSTLGRCLSGYMTSPPAVSVSKTRTLRSSGPARCARSAGACRWFSKIPDASLNPRRRIADIIAEPLRVHFSMSAAEVTKRVQELLSLVGLSPDHVSRFPHEFSGGQRQRIGVARALALEPRLIVADEPVSALDVSIQAQIINLFSDLQERLGLTYIIIAHDLSVIRQVSNRTAVMYLGSIVETGPTELIYGAPAHPYTQALISAVPVPEMDFQRLAASGSC